MKNQRVMEWKKRIRKREEGREEEWIEEVLVL